MKGISTRQELHVEVVVQPPRHRTIVKSFTSRLPKHSGVVSGVSMPQSSYTHIYSGVSNDVQAVGMINYSQGIDRRSRPANPGGQLTGYVVDTLTGPTNAQAGASVHLPGNVPRYSAPLLARPRVGAQKVKAELVHVRVHESVVTIQTLKPAELGLS